MYHKPTDNKQYLHFNSAHPWKQKKSVPFGLLIRYKRICSEEKYFEEESKIIIQKLTSRKYPIKLLWEALYKVKAETTPTQTEHQKGIPKIKLITHYNSSNSNFHQILHDHTGLLLMTRKEAINPNLKDILLKGSLENTHQPKGCTPCGKPRCKTCDHIQQGITIVKQQETFPIRGCFTCQSKNVVYLLTCIICNKQYIGKTEQTLRRRCRGHESNMRRDNDNIVLKHYKEYNHTSDDYTVTAIDRETDYNKRLRLEEAWILLLESMHPKGLNSRM